MNDIIHLNFHIKYLEFFFLFMSGGKLYNITCMLSREDVIMTHICSIRRVFMASYMFVRKMSFKMNLIAAINNCWSQDLQDKNETLTFLFIYQMFIPNTDSTRKKD